MEHPEPITVIILSRNRPIYLWTCLDSLYRYTVHPVRFVLVDNASDDPTVREVVRGFERRGMFHKVEWHTENDPRRVLLAVREHFDGPNDKIVVIESDVAVFDTQPCWLTRMSDLLDANPDLGLLGSYIDTRDFIPLDAGRALLSDRDPDTADALLKAPSPERRLPAVPPSEDLIEPFNPPGRLLMTRKSLLPKLIFSTDFKVYAHAKKAGISCAIATKVRHRHLSLLNAFDYGDYDIRKRDFHYREMQAGEPVIGTEE